MRTSKFINFNNIHCFKIKIKKSAITDIILLAHEIFDILWKKKGRKKGFGALKIDMYKAYDRINWNFLKAVLLSMNFSNT